MSVIKTETSYGYDLFCELGDEYCRWESYSRDGRLLRTETHNGRLSKTVYPNGRAIIYVSGRQQRQQYEDPPTGILLERMNGAQSTAGPREKYNNVMNQLLVVARNQRIE